MALQSSVTQNYVGMAATTQRAAQGIQQERMQIRELNHRTAMNAMDYHQDLALQDDAQGFSAQTQEDAQQWERDMFDHKTKVQTDLNDALTAQQYDKLEKLRTYDNYVNKQQTRQGVILQIMRSGLLKNTATGNESAGGGPGGGQGGFGGIMGHPSLSGGGGGPATAYTQGGAPMGGQEPPAQLYGLAETKNRIQQMVSPQYAQLLERAGGAKALGIGTYERIIEDAGSSMMMDALVGEGDEYGTVGTSGPGMSEGTAWLFGRNFGKSFLDTLWATTSIVAQPSFTQMGERVEAAQEGQAGMANAWNELLYQWGLADDPKEVTTPAGVVLPGRDTPEVRGAKRFQNNYVPAVRKAYIEAVMGAAPAHLQDEAGEAAQLLMNEFQKVMPRLEDETEAGRKNRMRVVTGYTDDNGIEHPGISDAIGGLINRYRNSDDPAEQRKAQAMELAANTLGMLAWGASENAKTEHELLTEMQMGQGTYNEHTGAFIPSEKDPDLQRRQAAMIKAFHGRNKGMWNTISLGLKGLVLTPDDLSAQASALGSIQRNTMSNEDILFTATNSGGDYRTVIDEVYRPGHLNSIDTAFGTTGQGWMGVTSSKAGLVRTELYGNANGSPSIINEAFDEWAIEADVEMARYQAEGGVLKMPVVPRVLRNNQYGQDHMQIYYESHSALMRQQMAQPDPEEARLEEIMAAPPGPLMPDQRDPDMGRDVRN
jgi:hypothetical protein